MQLTHEQLRQLERVLISSRTGIRQLAIVAAYDYARDLKARGRVTSDAALDEYVTRVAEPYIKPLDEALNLLNGGM